MEAKVSRHTESPAEVWSQRQGSRFEIQFPFYDKELHQCRMTLRVPPRPSPTVPCVPAARLTGMSEKTIHRRIKDGTLPAYRLGRAMPHF